MIIDSVYLIVRGHYVFRLRLFNAYLEALEVDLAQGALRHARIIFGSCKLLIVAGKVLGAGGRSSALDAAHRRRSRFAGNERIFGIIFKIPAAKRISVDVHTGSKQHIRAPFKHLLRRGGIYLLHQRRIKRAGKERAYGKLRAFCAQAYAGGAVRGYNGRNALISERLQHAGECASVARRAEAAVHRVVAAGERLKLLKAERCRKIAQACPALGNIVKRDLVRAGWRRLGQLVSYFGCKVRFSQRAAPLYGQKAVYTLNRLYYVKLVNGRKIFTQALENAVLLAVKFVHLPRLRRLLAQEEAVLAICFARTRVEVDEVTEALRARGFSVEALHGGLDQASRDRVMKRAKNGSIELIVATDVAARGIDLENLTHVVNLGLPASPETYVHRIGRTGRAGRSGMAISVIEPREHRRLRLLESHTKAKIEVRTVPTLTDARAKRLSILKNSIAEELSNTEQIERCRVIVESLCTQFDPMEVACAAVSLANRAVNGAGDEEEIPAPSLFDRPKREKTRPSRLTEAPEVGMSRIFIGAGHKSGVRPGDIVGAIANEAGIASRKIGAIEITESFTLVEVEKSVASAVVDSLKDSTIKGRRVTVRFDRAPKRFEEREDRAGKPKRKFDKKDNREKDHRGKTKDKKKKPSDTSRFYE